MKLTKDNIEPLPRNEKIRIVVEKDDYDKQTKSGIIIPDTSQKPKNTGTVITVGEATRENGLTVDCDVKVGDRVLHYEHVHCELMVDGKECVVIFEEDVLGILEES